MLGFLAARRHLELDLDDGLQGSQTYAKYLNVPATIGAVISNRFATLHELQTIYSIEDVYIMLEINSVDCHNRIVASKIKPKA